MKNDDTRMILFGGGCAWDEADWTDSDDRVRGGKSQSHLRVAQNHAIFYGVLDTKTLGGAGFASQRTTGEDRKWDLSNYDGIELTFIRPNEDNKKYTFIVKDELLPKDPDTGREQSTISWEYDFQPSNLKDEGHSSKCTTVTIPWKKFTPTYRGKVKKDAKPLKYSDVKRMSIMMRSFFGSQEGKFSLEIVSIAALKLPSKDSTGTVSRSSSTSDTESFDSITKQTDASERRDLWSWLSRLCCKI